MYSVFIQWNENTSNYRRFDGGLEVVGTGIGAAAGANRDAALWLFRERGQFFWFPWEAQTINYANGLQLGVDDTNVVIDFNSTEPASVDFGDGTIYVAEVE